MLQWLYGSTPSRRRTASHWQNRDVNQAAEVLEVRCPLAAMAGGGSLVHDTAVENPESAEQLHQPQRIAQRKGPAVYPDMTGLWRIVTDFGEVQINSVMEVVQHGRRIRGTFTTEFQPEGKVKGKFDKATFNNVPAGVRLYVTTATFASNGFTLLKGEVRQPTPAVKTLEGNWLPGDDHYVPVRAISVGGQ